MNNIAILNINKNIRNCRKFHKLLRIICCFIVLIMSGLHPAHAKSGYRICKSWSNIAWDVKYNLELIDKISNDPSSNQGIIYGKYPVALYEADSPTAIKEYVERNYDLFYGVGNFDLRIGGPNDSKSAILVLRLKDESSSENEIVRGIYDFISTSGVDSDNINSDEKRKNYAIKVTKSFINSIKTALDLQYSFRYLIDNSNNNSNFMILLIRSDDNGGMRQENIHEMAGAFAIFAGIPPIKEFKRSIFSSGNMDTSPTDVDVAMATAISGPKGVMGWRERYDSINAKCLEP